MFTKFMNVCKAAEVGDGGAVDKSVGMQPSVRYKSVGMRDRSCGTNSHISFEAKCDC